VGDNMGILKEFAKIIMIIVFGSIALLCLAIDDIIGWCKRLVNGYNGHKK